MAIGVTVFAGVTFATIFTLLMIPVAYHVLARRTKLPGSVAARLEELEAAHADTHRSGEAIPEAGVSPHPAVGR